MEGNHSKNICGAESYFFIQEEINAILAFENKNQEIDFRVTDLVSNESLERLQWDGVSLEKDALLTLLKAYQRILRVIPVGLEDYAIDVMQCGFGSALQIASTPKKHFIDALKAVFDEASVVPLQIYQRAIALRKSITLDYINRSQWNEPHARSLR